MLSPLKNPPAPPDYHWPPPLTNRRSAVRLNRAFPTSHGLAMDMSVTGIRLETASPMQPGSWHQLTLKRGVTARAEVVWTGPSWRGGAYQSGLRFLEPWLGLPAWLFV